MAVKKPSERQFKHTIFGGVLGGAGANSYKGEIHAWRSIGGEEEIATFRTVWETEEWLTEKGAPTRRFDTPALTLIRKGGGISGWALWDTFPEAPLIDAARMADSGKETKNFMKMRSAVQWLNELAEGGHVDEAPRDKGCHHTGVDA